LDGLKADVVARIRELGCKRSVELTGCDKSVVSRIGSGKQPLSDRKVIELAEKLGIELPQVKYQSDGGI
jgi:hypothetical protein